MHGLVVPEREADFTADPVELFFDLAFVFAFAQLVGFLVHDPDWEHVGKAALVFSILWMTWSQLTWAANAVAGNSRQVRSIFLVATATSVPMAASVTTALDGGGYLFAIPVALIASLGLVLALEGAGDDEAREQAREFIFGLVVFVVLLVVGAAFDTGTRTVIWTVAVVGYVLGTLRTSRTEWVLRAGHFAERHGLIIIVALGEVIVAVGKPLVEALEEGEQLSAEAVVALCAAGVFAALMWWSYFDRVQPALEHRVEETVGPERSSLARDNYTYLHLPITAGVILSAVGLEEITLHPSDALPLPFRAMLFAGLAFFFGGIGLAALRTFRAVARERLVAIGALALLLFLATELAGVWLIVAIDVLILASLAFEQRRIEH